MSKYIDAVKTAEIVSERHKIPLSELVDTFAEVPTADVVEVVRCKDCPYFRPYEKVEDFDGECIAYEIKTDKTEFCSIGCKSKRKDVEELMNDKL